MSPETIHIAHSVSRKHGGNVHCRAYVRRDSWNHTLTISNAGTREEAETLALGKIKDDYLRSGLHYPAETVNHGKRADIVVSNWHFGGDFK